MNMEQKRHLRINSAMCDISTVNESTLAAYESIVINSALVLTSPQTQALIPKYPLVLNSAFVMEKPKDAQVKVINGRYEITTGDVEQQPVALLVNGQLDINNITDAALEKYVLIHVNGSVAYPDTLSGKLPMLRVNGGTECYPADAIRLNATFVVNKTFKLRAKASQYYAKRRVVLLDAAADPAALCEKGVHFLTKTAVLAESLAEIALPLFSEEVEIHVIPDGCAYVEGETTLDEALLCRWGNKLFIAGDLVLNQESGPLLSQLEYVKVLGNVQLPKDLLPAFHAIRAEYAQLLTVKGIVIRDKVSFSLDKGLLERHPEGITFVDCVDIRLDEKIPPEWIEERLSFKDCVNIACAPHQRSAVELIGHNLATINMLSDENASLGDPDTQVINTAEFRLM